MLVAIFHLDVVAVPSCFFGEFYVAIVTSLRVVLREPVIVRSACWRGARVMSASSELLIFVSSHSVRSVHESLPIGSSQLSHSEVHVSRQAKRPMMSWSFEL